MKDEDILKVSEYLDSGDYAAIEGLLDSIATKESEQDYNYWMLRVMLARQKRNDDELFDSIEAGMRMCPTEYDMYNYLGDYYLNRNNNKAYLCYEMAEFYCNNDNVEELRNKKNRLFIDGGVGVKPVSIVIPSYNCKEMMQGCVESIRETCPIGSYEIVAVDNASTDGICEWLREQEDVVLIANDHNTGFPIACNQGINVAKRENDIFLLNNDTIVPINAIFWLRMGLYENDKVGATGSVSNFVTNWQKIKEEFETREQYLDWAYTNNVLSKNPYEKKPYLVGFALMMKRTVLDKVGLLDEEFSPGNYEDNDIGYRIVKAGYLVLLCKNSFIFHYGHQSFKKDFTAFNNLLKKNKELMIRKLGFSCEYYADVREDILSYLVEDSKKDMKVLEIGCGMGATMARIEYMYPNAIVKGIELNPFVAEVASNYLDIMQGNIEDMDLDFEEEYFDYIIFGDVLEQLKEPLWTLLKINRYLKPDGMIVASVNNALHYSVVVPLLGGKLQYGETGPLDKNNCRLFTKFEAIKMFLRAGYSVENIKRVVNDCGLNEKEQKLYDVIQMLPEVVDKEEFETFKYIFGLRKPEMVSVVIPVYNRENTIERCLQSVYKQTYTNMEIVVVDDGSTDKTVSIVKSIAEKDNRVKLYELGANSGVANARNFGIDQCHGKYIAFQDSDDEWLVNKLRIQMQMLHEKKADIVFGAFCLNLNGNKYKVPAPQYKEGFVDYELLLDGNIVSPTTVIGKADVIKKYKYDRSIHMYEDWLQMLDITKDGYKLYYCDQIFTEVYRQNNSLSNNNENIFKAGRIILDKYKNDVHAYNKLRNVFIREFTALGIIHPGEEDKFVV